MASSIWEAQPTSEQSRLNKICAGCEVKPATLLCSRCHCTRYCQKECQRKHWKSHKPECEPDPIYSLSEDSLKLPIYRKYSTTELEQLNKAYILEPGLARGPTGDRDAFCQLISPADQSTLDAVLHAGADQKQFPNQNLHMLGWSYLGHNPVMGYSYEDSLIYRLYYDDNFKGRLDLPKNYIANTLIHSTEHRGRFLVVKCPAANDAEVIPFPKSELVDIMTWRKFLGRNGLISSRMFRENMRKREHNTFLKSQGFKVFSMG